MTRRRSTEDLVVFLGPSLPAVEARSLTSGLLLPPARQGDVWRALALRPRVLVLIDGVFELQPSVWHRELLSALDAGVAVFGASSMGALRAAELDARGMIGIGTIYRGYAERRWVDDADVALLHAGEDDGYRPLTVPLVSVRHVAELAHRHRILTGGEARRLVETAGAMFYQERRWPAVLREMQRVWGSGVEVRFRSWFEAGVEDVKAADARACLCAAEAFRQGAPSALPRSDTAPESSMARRSRLYRGATAVAKGAVASGKVMAALSRRSDAETLAAAGARRQLLAGWARAVGLRVLRRELDQARRAWLRSSGCAERAGLDAHALDLMLTDHLLEERWLSLAPWAISDGPNIEESLADEARLRHLWAQTAEKLK